MKERFIRLEWKPILIIVFNLLLEDCCCYLVIAVNSIHLFLISLLLFETERRITLVHKWSSVVVVPLTRFN